MALRSLDAREDSVGKRRDSRIVAERRTLAVVPYSVDAICPLLRQPSSRCLYQGPGDRETRNALTVSACALARSRGIVRPILRVQFEFPVNIPEITRLYMYI